MNIRNITMCQNYINIYSVKYTLYMFVYTVYVDTVLYINTDQGPRL